jgi:hypothetical protein
VVPNDTAHRRAGNRMMSRHMTHHTAHASALQAAVRIANDREQRGSPHEGNRQQYFEHLNSLANGCRIHLSEQ